jgi:two-component SAPR family response regulator
MKITCLIIDNQVLARRLVENFAKRSKNVELVDRFDNLKDAFAFLEKVNNNVDAIFLNVRVSPVSTVLMFAQRGQSKEVRIVFTNSFPNSFYGDYDIRYFEWLQKPVPYKTFGEVLEKIKLDKIR